MTVLTDGCIQRTLASGELKIEPLFEGSIQPASVDVHLSPTFRCFVGHNRAFIDPTEDQSDLTEIRTADAEHPFVVHPGHFVLGSTIEHFSFPSHLVGRLEGKSSIARLGLIIHAAGFVDPGFHGTLTLELGNISTLPIKLHPGMAIGQVAIMMMSEKCLVPYGSPSLGSKYQGQGEPMASLAHQNAIVTPE